MQACRLRGQLAGWVNYRYEFEAAAVDDFAQPKCLPYVGHGSRWLVAKPLIRLVCA
jgi:hypothetical protein